MPDMMIEIQRHCGTDLPYIVGADLTTWWDSDTRVFGNMMRIGLPLIGPHAPTFYSPINAQAPSDAHLQLGYVFASRSIAHRLSVRALNDPTDWGPSDHFRILIEIDENEQSCRPNDAGTSQDLPSRIRSEPDPLDLVQRDPVPGGVVQARGLRGLLRGYGALVLEAPAVREIVGDARGMEAAAVDRGGQSGGPGANALPSERLSAYGSVSFLVFGL